MAATDFDFKESIVEVFPFLDGSNFTLKVGMILIAMLAFNCVLANVIMAARKVPTSVRVPILILTVVSSLALVFPPIGLVAVGYTWYRVCTA